MSKCCLNGHQHRVNWASEKTSGPSHMTKLGREEWNLGDHFTGRWRWD
jgi:hypothetical protein